jgi:glycosyltransferase involved in cell wall biosynthesis
MSKLFRCHGHRFWDRLRREYFVALDLATPTLVCPSPSVQRNLKSVDRRFAGRTFHVIEHGINRPKRYCFGGAEDDRRLRFIVLGHLSVFKGLDRLRRLLPRLRLFADVHLVGSGAESGSLTERRGVHHVDGYRQEELPEILATIRPDLALMLGDIPETFSYTLSELWAHAIPVCAPRLGSFADRMVDGCDGFLIDLDLESWVERLVELDGNRGAIRGVAGSLRRTPVRDVGAMVEEYYALRDDWRE